MSRHSRTSTASPILKQCFEPGRELTDEDIEILRAHIMDNPQIPDEHKAKVIDLATAMVLHHDLYRLAYRRLEEYLGSLSVDVDSL